MKDPLYWLRILAPVAKEYDMVVNITTTLDVAQKIEKTDIVDIVAISIDDYRTGKDWGSMPQR